MKEASLDTVRTELVALLQEKRWTFAAAESCTGGLVGKLMTDEAGSSAYFMGSVVTYQNEGKIKILGVREETLQAFTAVSDETAKEMAQGARRLYESNIAVSVTGYAGPGNGERGEAPGTVYIGVAGGKGVVSYLERFDGDREAVRKAAARKSLQYAIQYIKGYES